MSVGGEENVARGGLFDEDEDGAEGNVAQGEATLAEFAQTQVTGVDLALITHAAMYLDAPHSGVVVGVLEALEVDGDAPVLVHAVNLINLIQTKRGGATSMLVAELRNHAGAPAAAAMSAFAGDDHLSKTIVVDEEAVQTRGDAEVGKHHVAPIVTTCHCFLMGEPQASLRDGVAIESDVSCHMPGREASGVEVGVELLLFKLSESLIHAGGIGGGGG